MEYLIFIGEEIIDNAESLEEAITKFEKLPKPKDSRPSTKRAIYKLIKTD